MTEPRLEQLDNPAARIEAVLMRAQPYAQGTGPALDGWKAVFEVNNLEELSVAVAEFITQLRLAREAVELLPESEDPEYLLKYFPLLDDLPAKLLAVAAHNMSAFRDFVTDKIIYSLAGCSRALRRHGTKEPTLDSDALVEILGLVAKLIDEVSSSDTPTFLKVFTIQRLQEVEQALRFYRITGYTGVEHSIDGLVGVMWRAPQEEKKRAESWIVRIIAKVQSLARGSAELATSTQTVIESVRMIGGN